LSWLRIALGLAALLASTAPGAESSPQRIVSMNLCLDSVLVELVPRENILALSQYARDPWRSTIAAIAEDLPYTNETAEEVVALKPDLVITSRHSAIATRNALRRVGIRFELFAVPQTVAESLMQIRQLSALLQRQEQGEALIARIEQAIARARPAAGEPVLTAAVYQPGGLSLGAGTVTSELMQIAGLENIAVRYGLKSYRPLPLERLISEPPDILLVGDTTHGAPTHSERIVHHRALRALQFHMRRESFPARLLYCSGPAMIEALAALVAAREHRVSAALAPGEAPVNSPSASSAASHTEASQTVANLRTSGKSIDPRFRSSL
jgi:iron complex transport system substrate-binding protein